MLTVESLAYFVFDGNLARMRPHVAPEIYVGDCWRWCGDVNGFSSRAMPISHERAARWLNLGKVSRKKASP